MDKFVEAFENFRNDLRLINQKWDNRFRPDKAILWESYINGDFEVILHYCASARGSSEYHELLVRIVPHYGVSNDHMIGEVGNNLCCGPCEGDGGDDVVVLVGFIQLGERPESKISVSVRFYFVLKKQSRIGAGQGLLYLFQARTTSRYKTLPYFVKRERDELGRVSGITNDSRRGEIESCSEVVDCVPYHEGKWLANVLFGGIEQKTTCELTIGDTTVDTQSCRLWDTIVPRDLIEISGKGVYKSFKLTNVLIGPLNL